MRKRERETGYCRARKFLLMMRSPRERARSRNESASRVNCTNKARLSRTALGLLLGEGRVLRPSERVSTKDLMIKTIYYLSTLAPARTSPPRPAPARPQSRHPTEDRRGTSRRRQPEASAAARPRPAE